MSEPLLDAGQVAARLGVPKSWPLREARAGRIPYVPVGRYVRFRWSSIEAWLDELEKGPTPYRRYAPHAESGGPDS